VIGDGTGYSPPYACDPSRAGDPANSASGRMGRPLGCAVRPYRAISPCAHNAATVAVGMVAFPRAGSLERSPYRPPGSRIAEELGVRDTFGAASAPIRAIRLSHSASVKSGLASSGDGALSPVPAE